MIRKIEKAKIIKKDRFIVELPVDVEIDVKKGDKVNERTVLYTQVISDIIETHFLPKSLGIRAVNSANYIGRVAGQLIEKGDLLAEKLSGAGLITKRIIAGTDGIISTKRIKQGYIDILDEAQIREVTSPVDGIITGITLGKRIEIESSSVAVDFLAVKHLNKAAHHVDSLSGEHVVGGNIVSLVRRVDNSKQSNRKKTIDVSENVKSLKDSEDFAYPNNVDNSKENIAQNSHRNAIEFSMNIDPGEMNFKGKLVYVGNYLYPDIAKKLYQREAIAIIANAMDYTEYIDLNIPIIILNGFGIQSGRENYSFEQLLNEALMVKKELFVEVAVESSQLHIFGLPEKVIADLSKKTARKQDKSNIIQMSTFLDLLGEVKVGDFVKSLEPESFGMSGKVVEIQDAVKTGETGTQILIVVRDNGSHFITDALTVEIVL